MVVVFTFYGRSLLSSFEKSEITRACIRKARISPTTLVYRVNSTDDFLAKLLRRNIDLI